MAHAFEFHGRLGRADGPPARPGRYDLHFRLHPDPEGDASLWQDDVRGIPVSAGGYYHVVLGAGNALHPDLFDGSPRYLSVRVRHGDAVSGEAADRVPLLGLLLRVATAVAQAQERLAALEAGARDRIARRRVNLLRRRLQRVQTGDGGLASLAERLATVEARIARIEGEGGPLRRMEDELEDLVGPDGDVVDLDARLCRLEGVATPGDHDRLGILERRLSELEARLKRR